MGWDYSSATRYKRGQIDRKEEADKRFTWANETQSINVIKSSMVGSVYYAAVEKRTRTERKVIGVVVLTSVRGGEIGMKVMEETCGPTECKCPLSILKLLSPTDSEWANQWREKCLKWHLEQKEKRKNPLSLKNLPEGTKVRFALACDTTAYPKGTTITLEKRCIGSRIRKDRKTGKYNNVPYVRWTDGYYRWPEKMIPEDYAIIS